MNAAVRYDICSAEVQDVFCDLLMIFGALAQVSESLKHKALEDLQQQRQSRQCSGGEGETVTRVMIQYRYIIPGNT